MLDLQLTLYRKSYVTLSNETRRKLEPKNIRHHHVTAQRIDSVISPIYNALQLGIKTSRKEMICFVEIENLASSIGSIEGQ